MDDSILTEDIDSVPLGQLYFFSHPHSGDYFLGHDWVINLSISLVSF
jgi:hypothetical protein